MANGNHKPKGKEKTIPKQIYYRVFFINGTYLFTPDHCQHKIEEIIF